MGDPKDSESKFAAREKIVDKNADVRTGLAGDVCRDKNIVSYHVGT